MKLAIAAAKNTIRSSQILIRNAVRNYVIPRNLHSQSSSKLPNIACKELNNTPNEDFSSIVANHILYKGLTNTPQENPLCSPFSMNAVLNMLVPGSRGLTLDQSLELLKCKREEHLEKSSARLLDVVRPFSVGNGPDISFSNAVWVEQQSPLMHSYEDVLRDVHKADVMTVDFQNSADEAIKEVNRWAKQKTKGMIKNIIGEVAYYNETIMVLANALHLKLDFPDNDSTSPNKDHSLYHCGSFEDGDVLRMPYNSKAKKDQDDRNFSMYIFVPSSKQNFPENFSNNFHEFIKTPTERNNEEASRISIPTFYLESDIALSATMEELGLTLPFRASQRDLVGLVDSSLSDLLYVTDVTQKCCIETDETGTTLGVATYATICGPTRYPRVSTSKVRFVADNPFFFMLIEDVSGAVIFSGAMLSARLTS